MARRPAKKKEGAAPSTSVPVEREERHPLTDLRAEMDRLFDSFVHRLPSFPTGRDLLHWGAFRDFDRGVGMAAPNVDVSETDEGYEVVAELPGMEQDDIDVELKDDVLTLSGEKTEEREETEKNYHLSERRFGSFRRTFRLPSEINQNKISANFKDGVLTIALPKTAKAQKPGRKIGVKSE
jgi:HSP20 family protein